MEDLTKQQIVLVTLLVSFVTSIATGIVTVSLMEQTPKGITQTINNVVEHTIERVVPSENSAAAVVTKETVVVSTEDEVVKAVDKNLSKIVKIRIFKDGFDKSIFLAEGILVSKDGLIISDVSIADQNARYEAVLHDGTHVPLTYKKQDASGIAFFALNIEKDAKLNLSPVVFADSGALKLGQNVITLSGKEDTSVSIGIIQSLDGKMATSSSEIATTIDGAQALLGSPLINLNGEVVGMKTAAINQENNNEFLASNVFRTVVALEISASTKSK